MTLRCKTIIAIAVTFIILFAVMYITSKVILMNSFANLEKNSTIHEVSQESSALSDELSALNANAADWSDWDDTYNFIANDNSDYIKANLVDSTFTTLDINVLLFVNASGHIVWSGAYDLKKNTDASVPASLLQHVTPGDLLPPVAAPGSLTGILVLPDGPMLVVCRSILTSEEKGPSRGTLIMGRYLDPAQVSALAKTTHLPLELERWDDAGLPDDFRAARSHLAPESPVFFRPLSENTAAGYALVRDIYGKPALILRVAVPRDIYGQGRRAVNYFFVWLVAIGLCFIAVSLLILEKAILARLTRLSRGVTKIGAGGDFSTRLPVTGPDEFSRLAASINGMLGALEESQRERRKSEELFREMADHSPVAIFIYQDGRIRYGNKRFRGNTGYTDEELSRVDPLDLTFPADRKSVVENVRMMLEGKSGRAYEHRMITKNGQVRWIIQTAAGIRLDERRAILGSFIDITERKEMEEELKYLSIHDPLTGLYNRFHFEREMRRVEEEACRPVSIVVCDVDGLKLVNETLGHERGDALLKAAGDLVAGSFRDRGVVARIGGDEFAVLLPGWPAEQTDEACHRLRESVTAYNAGRPGLSLTLSVGVATGDGEAVTSLLRAADNNMQREKLFSSQSTRSAIVQILMKALEARDFITEGHAERLQDLTAALARAVGLPEHEITALRLLAQFHDLGKVGIPDRILFKPGRLTPEETVQMQEHSRIGHRIARAAPELATIADWILKHHERWDGAGYPLGIAGEDIPVPCRILAIADAFDAMTSDRPYRKAMDRPRALAELERWAGRQFDPGLVPVFVRLVTGAV